MKYVDNKPASSVHKPPSTGGGESQTGEICYRRIVKGSFGKSVEKCENQTDETTCGSKEARGCKSSNCVVLDPDVPGYMRRITDIKDKLFDLNQRDEKSTNIIKGYCGDKEFMKEMGDRLGEQLQTNPKCYRKITKGKKGVQFK